MSLIELKISIQEFNKELEEINENQKESIASFYKASDLVKWMRIALPGCLFAVYFAICDFKQSLLMLKMSFCTLCKFCLYFSKGV